MDRKLARGQQRSTETDWSKAAPYLRFRYQLASRYLPETGNVIDMGCGCGVGTNWLAQKFPGLSFIGVDISKEAIELARHSFGNTSNLTFVHGQLRQAIEQMRLRKHVFNPFFLVNLC